MGVASPRSGFLWTPAYWGFEGGHYRFYNGYWGPHVGFYGGINYGFGYGGVGFEGGYWNGPHFFYNTAVVRFGGGFHPVVRVQPDRCRQQLSMSHASASTAARAA